MTADPSHSKLADADPHARAALIVTLEFDAALFGRLDELRKVHFPPALNRIPAHLSLIHQLPGDRLEEVASSLAALAPDGAVPLELSGLRLLGRGVAYDVTSPLLMDLHRRITKRWAESLIPQDRQKFTPHVTIQNKTSPQAARALRDVLARDFQPIRGHGVGLLVWRYLGGPWRLERRIGFGAAGAETL
ncbi:MAG: 2'-5' RNA ligase family protein [Caulobacteraceae bacterium]